MLTIRVELDSEMAAKLEGLAAEAQTSAADLAADLLARSIEAEANETAEIEARLAEAEAGGPFVEHDEVRRWMMSLGTDRPLPMPRGVRR